MRVLSGPEVGAVPGAKAAPGNQPLLPSPPPQKPFLEIGAELIGIVERRSVALAGDDIEPPQQVPDGTRFPIGDWQIMRAAREGRPILAAAPRVAAVPLLEPEQPEISQDRLRDRPAGPPASHAPAPRAHFRLLDCGPR